jgi:Restriction endonuclease BglII
LAFYVGDVIDVGVEIVPVKALSASTIGASGKRARQMSTGVPWYEKELYNLIREGRGVPGVPLVLIGVAP